MKPSQKDMKSQMTPLISSFTITVKGPQQKSEPLHSQYPTAPPLASTTACKGLGQQPGVFRAVQQVVNYSSRVCQIFLEVSNSQTGF